MANWLKKLFSHHTEINTETINNTGVLQQAGTINNYGISEDKLIELAKKLGVVESERNEWIRKYQDLEKQLANRSDDIAKQAKAFLDKGDLDQAGKLFDQALENDLKNAADNAYSAGWVKELQWDYPAAISRYQKAVQLNPDNAGAWNDLGWLLKITGELDQAIAAYQTVLKLGQSHQDQYEIAMAYGNLGLVYYTRGELDKAVEMHNKALKLNQELGNKQGMAQNYGNLGNVYFTRGELDKAIEMYQKSLAITESLGMKETSANQYANLGLVYEQKGNKAEAKRYWQKSIELYKYIGSPMAKTVQGWLDELK